MLCGAGRGVCVCEAVPQKTSEAVKEVSEKNKDGVLPNAEYRLFKMGIFDMLIFSNI